MLIVHRSNRVERLVESLGDVVAANPAGPFEAETVIVQGRGMERWLSMELSRRFGVWANPDFPFPRLYLLDLFERVLDADAEELKRFQPEALTWAIAARLPDYLDRPGFEALARYLAIQEGPAGLLSLSKRIAATFDDYVVFRPKMIEGWQKRCDGTWQSVLWRRLVEDLGKNHVGALARRLLDRLGAGEVADLPERISIFGVSTLAPLYLEIFSEIGKAIDVHLFVLSPSEEYWAHLRSRRDIVRDWVGNEGDGGEEGDEGEEIEEIEEILAREEGNRLLSSLGRIGREFQAVLEGTADYEDREYYEDPVGEGGQGTALQHLQSDMLHLLHRAPLSEHEPRLLDAADPSIAVHSCHGPMREVQVLYDQLRAMFDQDPDLRPRDIVVMTPDIDQYAPFVESIFAGGESGEGIPHRIADRKPATTSDIFDAFSEVLEVLRGRLTASDLVGLLRLPAVRRRFGFGDDDIEIVRAWIDGVAIRWGIDAAHRSEKGHPWIDQNTWEFGLRRLFLGYAAGGEEELEFAGVSGYPDVEGGDAEVLGKLVELCDRLFDAARRLRQPLEVGEWPARVRWLLDELFWQDNSLAFQLQEIRQAIDDIAARALAAGFQGEVDLATIAELIEQELAPTSLARGFLSGAITFCELVPMRTIPFKVVCLIGMRDEAFPRIERRPDFDLIGQKRRLGDRSRRDDDRYMFLEAVLSARQRLYVSFTGQSSHAKTRFPPSVVVQELLDAVVDSFVACGDDADGEADANGGSDDEWGRLIQRHPLQAFSPSYFKAHGTGLRSYSQPAYRGAKALQGEPVAPPSFLTTPVETKREPVVELDELVRFFENPSRSFVQGQLGVFLGNDVAGLDVREPVDLDALERWAVADAMLRRLLEGRSCDFESISRQGALPAGTLGRMEYDRLRGTVEQIVGGVAGKAEYDPIEVDLVCGETRVVGVLPQIGEGGQEYFQYSKVGQRHEVVLWLRHLAYCAARPVDAPRSRLFGRKRATDAAVVTFEPVDGAASRLSELLELYWAGRRSPLFLFEQASREYAAAIADGGDPSAAKLKADYAFTKEGGDRRDDYVRQLYPAESPFAAGGREEDSAAETALRVYGPLLAARSEEPL